MSGLSPGLIEPQLLQHAYGLANGLYLSALIYLLFLAVSHLSVHRTARPLAIRTFLLTSLGFGCLGLYNLFFQTVHGAVTLQWMPAWLQEVSRYGAPVALMVMTYMLIEATSTQSLRAYQIVQQFRVFIAGLYGMDVAVLLGLPWLTPQQAEVLILLAFVPHTVASVVYCLMWLGRTRIGLLMAGLFGYCALGSVGFAWLVAMHPEWLVEPLMLAVHLSFAGVMVLFSFLAVRLGQGELQKYLHLRFNDRLRLIREIHPALEQGQVFLMYQPQLDLASGRVSGLEALIRWRHPRWGLIPPLDFIPLVEATGLTDTVSRWVVEAAIAHNRRLMDQGIVLRTAINLSSADFHPPMVQHVLECLKRNGVPPHQVAMEITESVMLQQDEATAKAFAQLQQARIMVVLDDYGTGFSSLSYISRLMLGELKIDRSFVHDLPTNRNNQAIVASTVQLGGTLGLRVVAEGIEDEPIRTELLRLGCTQGQGYGLARPMTEQALTEWLATQRIQSPTSRSPT